MPEGLFSMRVAIAWLVASLTAGLVLGVGVCAVDVWVSPDDKAEFLEDSVMLSLMCAGVFAIVGGVFLLAVGAVARLAPWPRPWVEMLIAAAGCAGFSHAFVQIDFGVALSTPQSAVLVDVLPAVSGALFALVYWLLAKRARQAIPNSRSTAS
jgi:hypothetical protein